MITPYLDRLDGSNIYTNFGPLNTEIEDRYAERLGLGKGGVTTVGNATLGLMLGLQLHAPPPQSLCILPAWTFIATPLAVMGAGMTPYFVDVDPLTWELTPEIVEAALRTAPGVVGAIMPVFPFGRISHSVAVWDEVTARTGIPVVIDAAAAVDTLLPGRSLCVVSLHATKLLGCGEGGFACSTDARLIAKLRSFSSFGFQGTRDAMFPGTNAKMSEYHAAVGLAALDHWPQTRAAFIKVAQGYAHALLRHGSGEVQAGFGSKWVSPTCVVSVGDDRADLLAARLAAEGIETRRWWEGGAHAHPATRHLPRTSLPVTEHLARSTLGLPFHLGVTPADIERIAQLLRD
jgi:dTDP-4-amino-4,6-dideoxygalactose transaminase